jgi:hypothetical protein
MLQLGQLRRILVFYLFLLITNFGILFYELFLVKMTLEQSLVFRGVTLITDVIEAVIFIESFKNLATYILKFFRINIRYEWIVSGLKLALIGPTIYLLKLFIVNSALRLVNFGIQPVADNKILLAYFISFCLSFFWGAIWVLGLEKLVNSLIRSFSKKSKKNKL